MTRLLRIKQHPGLSPLGELLMITLIIGSLLWGVKTEHTALHVADRWVDARVAAGEAAAEDREQLQAAYQAAYTWEDAAGDRSTYPVSRDSYYFMRLARNIIETGTPCPASPSTGSCRDMQVNPFSGRLMNGARSPHPWAIALVYKVLDVIGTNPSMLEAGLLHNRLMLIVCGLLVYLLARCLAPGAPRSSALAAAVTVILIPAVIKRCFGVDNDVWVLTLLLGGTLATAHFLNAAISGYRSWFSLIIVILAPVLLYATWGGWYFLPILQCSVAFIAFAVTLYRGRNREAGGVYVFKIIIIAGIVLLVFIALYISHWLTNQNAATEAATGALPPPDAFAAIAELAPIKINQFINGFTWPVLLVAGTGLAAAIRRLWLWKSNDFPATLLLVLAWFAGTGVLLLTSRYERFLIILAPPIAVLAGLGISAISTMLPRPALRPLATAGLSLLLIIIVTVNAITLVRNNRPQLNSAWVAVLNHLSQTTPGNAILLGWWNAGHWITYWSRRATAIDGASLRNPRVHDVGRLLATGNEGALDTLVDQAACGKHSDCQRPIYLLTSDDLLYELGWMFSGYWQAKRAYLVDQLAVGAKPTGMPADLLTAARKIHTPLERSEFAAPAAQIWSTHWSPCRAADNNIYNCQLNITSKDGWFIERLVVPAGHVSEARLVVRGHAGVAPILLKPALVRLATRDQLADVVHDTSTNNPGILLDTVKQRAFLGTPAVLHSLVVRLVLLDGRYDQERFQRVISASTVDGHQVTAWRVLQ